MVYCGRPSTSCNNCRVKKRRCDKAVPECGQCRRMGHECGGYRDPTNLIFHDESSKVIGKARSRATKETAFPQIRPADRSRSHSLTNNTIPQTIPQTPVPQSTFNYVTENAFSNNSLPLDHFDLHNEFSAEDNLYPLYAADLDSILAQGGAGIEPGTMEIDHLDDDNSDNIDHDKQGSYNDHNSSNSETMEQSITARPFFLSIDVVGLNFFMSNYVIRPSGPSSGFLDYTFAILAQEDSREMLEGAVVALGLAGLAQKTQQDSLMHRATTIYAHTKESLDRAMNEPRTARQDSTIVTVLILALYEFSKGTLEGWKGHVNTAGSLLALRGKAQLTTQGGIQIFKDVFSHLLMNSIYLATPMPPGMRMLRIEAAEAAGASDPYWIATGAAVELLSLYRYIRPDNYSLLNGKSSSDPPLPIGRPKTFTMPIEELELHLSQALEIDKRLETCFSDCSPEWQFAAMKVASSSSLDRTRVQGDVYHVYHDVWVANVWNLIRICRIMSNHAIGHLVLRGANADGGWFFSNQYADRLQQVSRIMVSIRDDILASIPQQMGYVTSAAQDQQHSRGPAAGPPNSGIRLAETSSAGSSSSDPPACLCSPDQITYTGLTAGAYLASWALAMVGCLHCLEDEPRAWTVAQLRRISSRAALGQAEEFAHSVEANKLRPPLS